MESSSIMSVFRILFHFFKLVQIVQFALGSTAMEKKIRNECDKHLQYKRPWVLKGAPFSIYILEILQDITNRCFIQHFILTLNSFNVKASREQFIGFNIAKLRFEYSDTKCAEIKGKSKNDTNIEIRGSEEKKITYAPISQFTQPLSSSRCAKVIVQYK